ncbi:DUF3617 domain-containing protein [Sphingobium bisphenolivorans]|uniref:DUF3617 domain-containing protein n=1 Tax=Sphingobium bisphenolivorans TaxID=1335760 RepID=UPI00047FDE9E|nr:DUF3617 domain-containing protein [Sphingobium bisphenolivorans]
MVKMLLGLVAATALVASCGEKRSNEPQTREEVRQEVQKVQLKPGQWEGAYELTDIDMPNMPAGGAQMKDQMKKMMSRTSMRYCVTPEEAANPSGKMFSGQENKDCTYKGFDASGGSVKGEISCKSQGGTMNAVMTGDYGPESYAMHMDMKMVGAPNGMNMSMKAKTSGKWTGSTCAAK